MNPWGFENSHKLSFAPATLYCSTQIDEKNIAALEQNVATAKKKKAFQMLKSRKAFMGALKTFNIANGDHSWGLNFHFYDEASSGRANLNCLADRPTQYRSYWVYFSHSDKGSRQGGGGTAQISAARMSHALVLNMPAKS